MLVLSRKDGQSIQIGEDVIVKIAGIEGNRVKIAIEAPREIRIVRSELHSITRKGHDEDSGRSNHAVLVA